MRVIRKEDQKTTSWSGGLTTEILIYPEESNYKALNFEFRLSTATVEIETSVFTPLPGVDRTLMVLDGEMMLDHEGHHKVNLKPLDKDMFKGDWNTRSLGKCADFNLMCRAGAVGDLQGYELNSNEVMELALTKTMNYLYVSRGSAKVSGEILNTGDLLEIDKTAESLTVTALKDSQTVLITIRNTHE